MELPSKGLPSGLLANRSLHAAQFLPNSASKSATRLRILVIDSDSDSHDTLASSIDDSKFELVSTLSPDEAISRFQINPEELERLHAVFFGLSIPANRALQLFARVKEFARNVPIYVLAARDALEAAKTAQALGATGILLKPLNSSEMADLIQGRSAFGHGVRSSLPNLSSVTASDPFARLIGHNAGMQKVVSMIRKVAPSDVNVLITGESGSGKELVASAIHLASARAKKPFIALNCAAIPKDLLESELFGHAKGAFTGAQAARRGLFEEAHEGTILLDEIGDLPLPLQAKILRLIQTKQVKPLGSNVTREVNVRILSATHKNLKTLIQKGEFREDLYYRLNVMPIQIPALRERREDIPLLAEHFMLKHKSIVGKEISGFTRAAIQKLQSMPWKGNVRELENTVERAMVLSEGSWIDETDISIDDLESATQAPTQIDDFFNSNMSLKDIEREYIKHVLKKTGNRKEAATKILGIDRKTLYRKEKLYGLKTLN